MNILLQTKKEVETFFGKQGTMAANLLDMVGQGEKASGWLLGAMDNGYDLTIGFFKEKARYVAFRKRTGSKWTEADVRACLMVIGDFSCWTSKPGSEFFDYVEKEAGKITASATGWHSSKRRYAFVYVPVVAGQVALIPAKDSVDKKFPS